MSKQKYGNEYSWLFRKVDPEDKELLQNFKCEYKSILEFIQTESLDSNETISYVLIDKENKVVVGFCAINCTGISINAFDTSGNPYITSIPAIEIRYFAIDKEYRHMKLSEDSEDSQTLSLYFLEYMINVIKRISNNHVGASHICLYSVPKAVTFYKKGGFIKYDFRMNSDENPYLSECVPMFYPLANN